MSAQQGLKGKVALMAGGKNYGGLLRKDLSLMIAYTGLYST